MSVKKKYFVGGIFAEGSSKLGESRTIKNALQIL